jgi:hypothetical protein
MLPRLVTRFVLVLLLAGLITLLMLLNRNVIKVLTLESVVIVSNVLREDTILTMVLPIVTTVLQANTNQALVLNGVMSVLQEPMLNVAGGGVVSVRKVDTPTNRLVTVSYVL